MSTNASAPIRCPVCSGENLTAEASYVVSGASLRFRNAGKKKVFGPNYLHTAVNRGRVCLDCGHVVLFLSSEEMERLRNSPAGRR